MDETEAWVTVIKYGIVLCIVAGICYTAHAIASLFVTG